MAFMDMYVVLVSGGDERIQEETENSRSGTGVSILSFPFFPSKCLEIICFKSISPFHVF